MKLTDQEQVIVKAIGHGVAEISRVIQDVGYPKATVKKVLVRLSEKGIVSLHRHDWPQSLAPAQRKLMVRIESNYYNAVSMRKRNPKSRSKTALKTTGRALKGLAKGALSAGSQILGAGATALNPVRRKIRNKYIDLVIKGQAKKTPQGWKVGRKTFAQGRGTVSVSSGYYLDKHTGLVYAKRERNKAKKRAKRKRNVSEGFYDASGTFHPIRSSEDYSPTVAGETGRKAKTTRSRKKIASKRKASQTARRKRVVAGRKKTTSRLAGKSLKKSSGLLKKRGRKNPSAESIRKTFAGSVSGERDLFFPQGTPAGKLAKLGKLVSITTKAGTIKPVSGTAWLCADTKGKLHIGSTSNAPLIDGPARNFGQVTKLEYEGSKPHLGYRGPIIWFHRAGEENGIKPTLRADGKGGLVFRGGDYRLTSRGIEN